MSKRHAYLIMAHHRPELLQRLVRALDDSRNDIFIHLDKRSDINPDDVRAEKSGLFFISRMKVNWGGYSQIKCAVRLLETAVQNDAYAYYHLMTGATYPLRSQDEIHDFFDAHQGAEFIQIDSYDFEERVRYLWLFNEIGKVSSDNFMKKRSYGFVQKQRAAGIDLFRKYNMDICKGLAYWSVTHELAAYIVENRRLVKKMFRHSWSGDEMFVQILAYNSKFRDRLYCEKNGTYSSLRFTTWEAEDVKGKKREGHNFEKDDISDLLGAEALFALKFEGPDGPDIIEVINQERNIIQ